MYLAELTAVLRGLQCPQSALGYGLGATPELSVSDALQRLNLYANLALNTEQSNRASVVGHLVIRLVSGPAAAVDLWRKAAALPENPLIVRHGWLDAAGLHQFTNGDSNAKSNSHGGGSTNG